MLKRNDLDEYICEALHTLGGEGTIVEVTREIWLRHEQSLRMSGDLFYTWQYDIRWARKRLVDQKILTTQTKDRKSVWKLLKQEDRKK